MRQDPGLINEFSEQVHKELLQRKIPAPSINRLSALLSTTFYATLEKDESQPIVFDLIYLNPKNPDPDPPPFIRNNRWKFIPFSKPMPFDVDTIAKLALATDRRTSLLAVYPEKNKLFIWGLVDQGTNTELFQSLEADGGFSHPGSFHVSAMGPGRIVVSIEFETIAELKGYKIMNKQLPAFEDGAIVKALTPTIKKLMSLKLGPKYPDISEDMSPGLEHNISDETLNSLRRLILRINSYGHGGAVLITPQLNSSKLKIKYSLSYERLSHAIVKESLLHMKSLELSEAIYDLSEESENLPLELYMESVGVDSDLEDTDNETAGSLWFTSLLSRVDGLILMDTSLTVKGFGVEILETSSPEKVYQAGDIYGSKSKRRLLDYEHFGTRHRSMMRYCAAVPGSIGFVVSQDGGVKIMTLIEGDLLVWTNVQLKRDFESWRNRNKKARIDPILIDKVMAKLPDQPWPTGITRSIASELGVSTNKVSNIVDLLIDRGIYRRQVNGVLYDRS